MIGNKARTGSVYQGCPTTNRCVLCKMCTNYRASQLKCRQCYPWPLHCICKDFGASDKVSYITNKLDTSLYDENKQGNVKFYDDPIEKYEEFLGDTKYLEEAT